MNLKDTLLMPKTTFEMRGNLNKKEPTYIALWDELNLYKLMLNKNKGKTPFILHDGPPYANGDIHSGHMLNRNLKDFVIRLKNMQGYDTPFILGWDTHGLPIENQVTKSGVDRKKTPTSEFRTLCYNYALTQVERQKAQIKRLGIVGDYDNAYLTLTSDFEATELEVFKSLALKGLIYRGKKPVHWSPSSESALAEAEIVYEDVTSPSVYVRFLVTKGNKTVPTGSYFVIWTTTPWTLPANLAISVHPRFTYGLYRSKFGDLVVLSDLAAEVSEALGAELTLKHEFKGQDVEFLVTKHPLFERNSIVILGEHVTNETGTGSVHTAPGHGIEDFLVGQKYDLPAFCPVDERGVFTDEALKYAGLFYLKANDVIISDLEANRSLLSHTTIRHSYPHDWRTNKPLIFRATPQWFMSISPIREELLNAVSDVTWYPKWGEQRITNMIKDRADWCISRQRVWGVPIPVIYAEDGTPLLEEVIFDHIISLVREHGTNIWFTKEAIDLLPPGYKTSHSPNGKYTKEQDIMDVWFDSGSSAIHVSDKHGLAFPSDLFLEGNDQYRGWFNSSLTLSVAAKNKAPYKSVLTHGFVVDEKGEKMSKSVGNVLDPQKLAEQYGADILRLWTATVDYQSDARLSDDALKQTSEMYRKIRNTFRFILGNLPAFTSESELEELKKVDLFFIDRLILNELYLLSNSVVSDYNHYNFLSAITKLTNFMTNDLSAFYLDITKDILYCESLTSARRKAVVRTLYTVITVLLPLFAPVLAFTTEEIYAHFNVPNKEQSVHLLSFPQEFNVSRGDHETYEAFHALRDEVLRLLEEKRQSGEIGSSQKANLTLVNSKEPLLETLSLLDAEELARLFIVSNVTFGDKTFVEVSEASKCDRCWNYKSDTVVINEQTLCGRCREVLSEN